jgi:phospholipid/cholesterol/gamma-HCH transport system permease protein
MARRLSAAHGEAFIARENGPDSATLRASGSWEVENIAAIDAALAVVSRSRASKFLFDLSAVGTLDTAGAWLVYRTRQVLEGNGGQVELIGLRPEHELLLRKVAVSYRPCEEERPRGNPLLRLIEHLGEATLSLLDLSATYVAFLGRAFLVLLRAMLRPRHLRFTSVMFHVEQIGINALPIVGLISFLIGIVLVYQGALQLANFGANIFVVDLLALSVLRELGILLTAIVVAGRSGSAFAAQIGSMKLHEEIDALQTLGVDPMEVLVLPRALALMISLPLLTLFADLAAMLGGGLMCWLALDLGPDVFLARLQESATVATLMVGIVKAPAFAALIALAGCYEGMQVGGSAESVGHHTTRSVVESIFLVIVADALFSILFGLLGI